jgi:hypothetical protein
MAIYWPSVAAHVSASEAAAAKDLGQALRTEYHNLPETYGPVIAPR